MPTTKYGGDGWIRTTALFRGEIYSLVQSTTLPRLHIWWTDGESNPDPRLAKPLCSRYHYQPKLKYTTSPRGGSRTHYLVVYHDFFGRASSVF